MKSHSRMAICVTCVCACVCQCEHVHTITHAWRFTSHLFERDFYGSLMATPGCLSLQFPGILLSASLLTGQNRDVFTEMCYCVWLHMGPRDLRTDPDAYMARASLIFSSPQPQEWTEDHGICTVGVSQLFLACTALSPFPSPLPSLLSTHT